MTALGYALLELACVLLIILALELLHALFLRKGKANSPHCSDCLKGRLAHSQKPLTRVSESSDRGRE